MGSGRSIGSEEQAEKEPRRRLSCTWCWGRSEPLDLETNQPWELESSGQQRNVELHAVSPGRHNHLFCEIKPRDRASAFPKVIELVGD